MKTIFILLSLLGMVSAAAQPSNTVPKNIRASNTLTNLTDLAVHLNALDG